MRTGQDRKFWIRCSWGIVGVWVFSVVVCLLGADVTAWGQSCTPGSQHSSGVWVGSWVPSVLWPPNPGWPPYNYARVEFAQANCGTEWEQNHWWGPPIHPFIYRLGLGYGALGCSGIWGWGFLEYWYWVDTSEGGQHNYDCDGIPDIADNHPAEADDVDGNLGDPGCRNAT